MNNIIYYMPRILKEKKYSSAQDFLKLVGKNASAIDRTGSFKLPFDTHIVWPIPAPITHAGDTDSIFADAMISRAVELLSTGKTIIIFYSGGLDSTGVLVAFHEAVKIGGFSEDQIKIATSADAMYENIQCWWEIVLKYEIINVHDCLNNLDPSTTLYIMGENADQLFGSDKIFHNPEIYNMLISENFTEDNLNSYISTLGINKSDDFMGPLHTLISKAPFRIKTMRDLLWWINFSCKWQSVSLRTLCFTNIFEANGELTHQELSAFETFYNHKIFQQISMLEQFKRWGDNPCTENYKYSLRLFIHKYHISWAEYLSKKVKVGSLYNVVKHRHYTYSLIYLDKSINKYKAT